jgi:hypothetical protein
MCMYVCYGTAFVRLLFDSVLHESLIIPLTYLLFYVFQHSRRVVTYCNDADKQQVNTLQARTTIFKNKTRRVLSGSVCLSQASKKHA